MPHNNPIFKTFLEFFSTLTLEERIALGAEFNKHTKGRLSPFNSPCPVAIALIPVQTKDGLRLLGGVRGIEPGYGLIALPGGYLEPLEHGSTATAREVFEETGLVTDATKYKLVGEEIAKSNTTLLFYLYNETFGEEVLSKLIDTPEVLEHVLISPTTPIAFALHKKFVDWFFENHK